MNIFAWNITLVGNKKIELDFDFIENISKNWDKVIFVFWETELETSSELLKMFEEKLWDFKNYDLSISSEDNMEIIWETYEEWIYELATFEWEEVSFDEIFDRFKDFEEVVSIREAEDSERFWNKKIKVDFVY